MALDRGSGCHVPSPLKSGCHMGCWRGQHLVWESCRLEQESGGNLLSMVVVRQGHDQTGSRLRLLLCMHQPQVCKCKWSWHVGAKR